MADFNLKKLYYSISEVSKMTDVEQYVLRYWESVFDQLKPQKNRAGNRAYTNKNIQLILLIKTLLREKKYTIEGAKKVLEDESLLKKTLSEELSEPKNIEVAKETKIENKISLPKEVNLKQDLIEIKNTLEAILKKL
ncbi:MAG: MerR family transcriptional regulator [Chlorobiaceae bacterium]|nr:MerR family transcriptional regulator [Chlorobiaceae bacterium]